MATDPNDFDMINLLWGLVMVPIGWIWNMISKISAKLDKAHERISDLEVHVAEKYVRTDDFVRLETRIMTKLNSIEDKIDKKADK